MSRQRQSQRAVHAWRGRLFLWGGRGLYVGPAFATSVHAHHAVQVCIALDGTFHLRRHATDRWRCYPGAVIASDQPHQLDGLGSVLALLYLDPEGTAARRLAPRSARCRIISIPEATLARVVPALQRWWQGADGDTTPERLADELIDALVSVSDEAVALDPRVAHALELLRAVPERRIKITELAGAVGLSPSRLAHLFRSHTGLAIRRYLLWLRLGDALRELSGSGSLTVAAHAAGFADSAHFTRTFRRMLGLMPSALR